MIKRFFEMLAGAFVLFFLPLAVIPGIFDLLTGGPLV